MPFPGFGHKTSEAVVSSLDDMPEYVWVCIWAVEIGGFACNRESIFAFVYYIFCHAQTFEKIGGFSPVNLSKIMNAQ